jgi:hypothetical protein
MCDGVDPGEEYYGPANELVKCDVLIERDDAV